MPVTLKSQIGDGGFADIWRAIDDLDRLVAVKIIRSANVGVADALAHAKALARAQHPNVVTVFRVDRVTDPTTQEECDCVVMELLEGETLAKALSRATPYTAKDALFIGTGLMDGLAHIHAQGLVHGDLHEENVMITEHSVKIIDILYRDSLALLSSASKEFRLRRDVSNLQTLVKGVLDQSEFGHSGSIDFLKRLGTRPTISDIREAFHQAIGVGSEQPKSPEESAVSEHPFVDPAIYFYNERFLAAFPGVRNITYFNDPAQIMDRLDILLKNPLAFREPGKDPLRAGRQQPIWWWRGHSNLQIERYTRLTATDILINFKELRVRKAAVHNTALYYQCFVYLEFDPMEPTGLYQYEDGYIEEWSKKNGYFHEEYGLFDGHMITRAEYDDGAAVIKGKVVDTMGHTTPRARYITPYNLVIASQKSPINNVKFDKEFDAIMRGILDGTSSVEALASAVYALPKKCSYDE